MKPATRSTSPCHRSCPRVLACACALALCLAAHAQGTRVALDRPAEPLDQALGALARAAGVQVFFASALTEGKTAPPLEGSFTAREALEALLAGSGLVLKVQDERTYTVERARALPAAPVGDTALPEVRVQASGEPLPGELARPYAGGQVARGGTLGLLGQRDYMEAPFSITPYTEELIQDVQATTILDLLRLDPSITSQGPSSVNAFWLIRGFSSQVGTVRLNGLKGIAGEDRLLLDAYERVQIVKGPTALINGGINSLGGSIDVQTKRAADAPLTELSGRYVSNGIVGGHLDVGRRFGVDNAFGVRTNLSYSDGRAEIDRETRAPGLASIGADFRGERWRVDFDYIYQRQDNRGVQGDYFGYDPDVRLVPAPRDVRRGVSESSDSSALQRTLATNVTGASRVEYDVDAATTAYLAYGELTQHTYNARPAPSAAPSPDASTEIYDLQQQDYENLVESFEAGLRARFATGPVAHQLALAFTRFRGQFGFGEQIETEAYSTPVGRRQPSDHSFGGVQAAPLNATRERSYGVSDTLSVLGESVQLTLGLRRQKVEVLGFDFPAFGLTASRYARSATTGGAGLLLKPTAWLSLYGNYIEGLEAGSQVPVEAGETDSGEVIRYVNTGEVFPPFKTRQYEAGAKFDFGRFGATAAVYQIAKPNLVDLETGDPLLLRRSLDGEQRNRGIELSFFGEPIDGWRLLGGVSIIDPRLQKTQGGRFDGNVAAGVPKRALNVNLEHDLRGVPGLTLTGNVSAKSRQFLAENNAQQIRSWAIADLGLLYRLSWTRPVTLRMAVRNVFDKQYWATTAFGSLGYGDPRTYQVSATVSF